MPKVPALEKHSYFMMEKGHYGYFYKKMTLVYLVCGSENTTFILQMRSARMKLNFAIMVSHQEWRAGSRRASGTNGIGLLPWFVLKQTLVFRVQANSKWVHLSLLCCPHPASLGRFPGTVVIMHLSLQPWMLLQAQSTVPIVCSKPGYCSKHIVPISRGRAHNTMQWNAVPSSLKYWNKIWCSSEVCVWNKTPSLVSKGRGENARY